MDLQETITTAVIGSLITKAIDVAYAHGSKEWKKHNEVWEKQRIIKEFDKIKAQLHKELQIEHKNYFENKKVQEKFDSINELSDETEKLRKAFDLGKEYIIWFQEYFPTLLESFQKKIQENTFFAKRGYTDQLLNKFSTEIKPEFCQALPTMLSSYEEEASKHLLAKSNNK